MPTQPSFVVTGGAQGDGRAIAERLADDGQVVVLDVIGQLGWQHDRVMLVTGDACDPATAQRAATSAEAKGPLQGWVNNAAIFHDLGFADASAAQILDLITRNLKPCRLQLVSVPRTLRAIHSPIAKMAASTKTPRYSAPGTRGSTASLATPSCETTRATEPT